MAKTASRKSRLHMKGSGRHERKEFPFFKQAVDREGSQFEGYSAGIGNRDDGDDVILPGAFEKTITERVAAKRVKYIDQHNYSSTRNLWGHVTDASEVQVDPRDPSMAVARSQGASHLLWTRFFVSGARDPQEALVKIEEGTLDGLSIGYRPIEVSYIADDENENEDPIWAWLMGRGERHIHQLAWWETSSVIWGMNQAALVIEDTVKGLLEFAEMASREGIKVDQEEVKQAMVSLATLVKGEPDPRILRSHARMLAEMEGRVDQALKMLEREPDDDNDTRGKLIQVYDVFRAQARDAADPKRAFFDFVSETIEEGALKRYKAEEIKQQIEALQKELKDLAVDEEVDPSTTVVDSGSETAGEGEEAQPAVCAQAAESAGAGEGAGTVTEAESAVGTEGADGRAPQDQETVASEEGSAPAATAEAAVTEPVAEETVEPAAEEAPTTDAAEAVTEVENPGAQASATQTEGEGAGSQEGGIDLAMALASLDILELESQV